MADKVPQLRKGLVRSDLLLGHWMLEELPSGGTRASHLEGAEKAAWEAFLGVIDAFIAYVNASPRVTRKDVSSFFTSLENFGGIRTIINCRIGDGELTPTLLDKLVEKI